MAAYYLLDLERTIAHGKPCIFGKAINMDIQMLCNLPDCFPKLLQKKFANKIMINIL